MSLFTGRIAKAEAEASTIRSRIRAMKMGTPPVGADQRNVQSTATMIRQDQLRLARKDNEISSLREADRTNRAGQR